MQGQQCYKCVITWTTILLASTNAFSDKKSLQVQTVGSCNRQTEVISQHTRIGAFRVRHGPTSPYKGDITAQRVGATRVRQGLCKPTQRWHHSTEGWRLLGRDRVSTSPHRGDMTAQRVGAPRVTERHCLHQPLQNKGDSTAQRVEASRARHGLRKYLHMWQYTIYVIVNSRNYIM